MRLKSDNNNRKKFKNVDRKKRREDSINANNRPCRKIQWQNIPHEIVMSCESLIEPSQLQLAALYRNRKYPVLPYTLA